MVISPASGSTGSDEDGESARRKKLAALRGVTAGVCFHECVAVCCSVLQCVAVCCSVLQCAAV